MIEALKFEWVRLRTVRSTWFIALSAVLLTGLVAGLNAHGSRPHDGGTFDGVGTVAGTVGIAGALTPILVGVVGVFVFGHEYRFGTIRAALTAHSQRRSLFGAKLLVPGLFALLMGVVSVVVAYLTAAVVLGGRFTRVSLTEAPIPRIALGALLVVLGTMLVGIALGALLRNVPAAITILIVLPGMLEPLVGMLLNRLHDGLGKWAMPFNAGTTTVTQSSGAAGGPGFGPLAGGLYFYAFAGVLLIASAMLFLTRDA